MSFAYANKLPGVEASVLSIENTFEWGPATPWAAVGVVLAAAARDAGSTPTTVLRRGLVLGQIAASLKYAQYDPTATDGTQFAVGVLNDSTDLFDPRAGAATDRFAQMRVWGMVKPSALFGFDENARVMLSPRFTWDDLRQEISYDRVIAKTADYTVLAADNNTTFVTDGATGAVNFTLPTVGRGYTFRFLNTVNQNLTVTAASGKLIAFNNAAATSIAFSTSGNKIGAGVEIVSNSDGSKWIAIPTGSGATATIA